jgi:hypothetical protein
MRSNRIAVLVAASIGVLAVTQSAAARPAVGGTHAKLVVSTTSAGLPSVTITSAIARSDPALAKLQIYVPLGYTLNAPAPGVIVGTARAMIYVTDVNGESSGDGQITATTPNDNQLLSENTNCDPVPHAATWIARIGGPAGATSFPVYVNKATGAEAQFASYKLVVCQRAPDLPPNDPNRSPNGARLISLSLKLTPFMNPSASGEYRWRSVTTPYLPGTSTLNPAGAVEAQSLLKLPAQLSIAAKRSGKRVTVSGAVTEAGAGTNGVFVRVQHSQTRKRLSPLKGVRTTANGTYAKTVVAAKPHWYRTVVTFPERNIGPGACKATFGDAVPCISTWSGGTQLVSKLIRK